MPASHRGSIHQNLIMKSLCSTRRFPMFFLLLFAALYSIRCSDDKARQTATEQALTAEPPANTPDIGISTPATPTTAGTMNLAATSVDAQKGGQACIAVTARDFREIVSMQYTMIWDPAVLRFKEVKGFGLPGLAVNNFGVKLAPKGLLTYSWFDINVKGISQPDGVKLYEVCFDVIGEPGSKSYFQFANEPTVIELTNAASNFLDLKAEEGQVRVR
jgi:hypothetical protein